MSDVYVVIEWAIDYYYKIWGVFTNRSEAEEFVNKLKRFSEISDPELLDGVLHVEKIELDNNDIYICECVHYDKNGNVVRKLVSRLAKHKDECGNCRAIHANGF